MNKGKRDIVPARPSDEVMLALPLHQHGAGEACPTAGLPRIEDREGDSVIRLRSSREVDAVRRSDVAITDKAGDFPSDRFDVARTDMQANLQLPADASFLEFGPFKLYPLERRLFRNNVPVDLGSRALDILVLLSENAGDVVTKHSIVGTVWPGITIEESSLRVHIAKLRKALGDGGDGDRYRYIANIAGRGYSLVAAVAKSKTPRVSRSEALDVGRNPVLPGLPKLIGRDNEVARLAGLIHDSRFVTVHGFGGVGKTTVAIAAAEMLAEEFEDGVAFVDLGHLHCSREVETALIDALNLPRQSSGGGMPALDALKGREVLLVLDGCEHVIDAAAEIAEAVWRRSPSVTVLATSREPLRVDGEHVYALQPLEVPADPDAVLAGEIWRYPSAQLFLEKAMAAGYEPEHTGKEARHVASICGKLDGVPLALELAAGRVVVHGMEMADALVGGASTLLWLGRRTASSRQQTLMSSMDWSYRLLSDTEKVVLRRLSLFRDSFSLEDAQIVAVDESGLTRSAVLDALAHLIAKSLVLCGRGGAYRILQTVAIYGCGKLREADELAAITARVDLLRPGASRQALQSPVATRHVAIPARNAPLHDVIDSHSGEMPGW